MLRPVTSASLFFVLATFVLTTNAAEFDKPLSVEPTNSVARIATPYPLSYAVVQDFAFGSLPDSAFSVVNTADGTFKGMMSAGNFATFGLSTARQEFYIAETYFSRGTRGDRSDLVAIYDMENLSLLAEVEIPLKRAGIVTNKNASMVTESGKFFLVFNLTPGTSVSVIDLDTRTFVGEVATPGCSLAYPTKEHEFFMLCGDGALLNIALNDDGSVKSRAKSAPFINIDEDPLSEKASKVAGNWHFVSYLGDVQPIGAKDEKATPTERWSLTSAEEREANWRPAGWHQTAGHPNGHLWVIMTPNGYEGSHKDPGPEVWLFDTKQQKRLKRLKLKTPALSIDVSVEEHPNLLVVNAAGALDIYDANSGEYKRSIYDLGASPYQVHRMP